MADTFYGVDMGASFGSGVVATGAATTTKKVELRIEDGVTGNNKIEVLKALAKIKAHIETADAPA